MIEEDLDALAALFHADGEGLPRQDVDRILNPLHELLTVLQIDTPILIDNFKQVSHLASESFPAMSCRVSGIWSRPSSSRTSSRQASLQDDASSLP